MTTTAFLCLWQILGNGTGWQVGGRATNKFCDRGYVTIIHSSRQDHLLCESISSDTMSNYMPTALTDPYPALDSKYVRPLAKSFNAGIFLGWSTQSSVYLSVWSLSVYLVHFHHHHEDCKEEHLSQTWWLDSLCHSFKKTNTTKPTIKFFLLVTTK